MSHKDKNLTCSDCSLFFMFSAEEQGVSGELGYDQPNRCRTCRRLLEDARDTGSNGARARLRRLHARTVAGIQRTQRTIVTPSASFSLSL